MGLKFLNPFLGGSRGSAVVVPASVDQPVPAVSYFVYERLAVAPLGSNGVFTSDPIDMGISPSAKNLIVLSVSTDQNGTVAVQASDDGATWYTYSTSNTITSAGLQTSVNAPGGRYARIVYTNGAVAQGSFRLAYGLK